MPVRVWGMVEGELVELRPEADELMRGGLEIVGLPADRARTTADRVQAALANSGLMSRVAGVRIRVAPPVTSASSPDLDLPLAVAVLAGAGVLKADFAGVFAVGRLGLDGSVLS